MAYKLLYTLEHWSANPRLLTGEWSVQLYNNKETGKGSLKLHVDLPQIKVACGAHASSSYSAKIKCENYSNTHFAIFH